MNMMNTMAIPGMVSPLKPTVEVFEVEANGEAQSEDAGWYYWMSLSGRDFGDPQGPFKTEASARFEANSLFID